jgi:hypothetical protein
MKTNYEYLLSKVATAKPTQCLVWPYATRGAGYGVTSVKGVVRYIHQLAYEYKNGAIPPKWRIKWTCGNHLCFNPFHVKAVQPPPIYLMERLEVLGLKEGPCEEWPYAKFGSEYGNVVLKGHNEHVARIAYTKLKGKIPKGLDICHKCDNPPCFRPAHLFAGTRKDNMQDCVKKDRDNRQAKGRVGELHFKHKVTEKDVLKIYAMKLMGATAKTILTKFTTIGPSGISHILNGHCWKHLWVKQPQALRDRPRSC